MKSMMLTAAFLALALPAYAATRKFTAPTISKQQEQAYSSQTYKTEQRLKAGGKAHG